MSNMFDTRHLFSVLAAVLLAGLPAVQAANTANVIVRVTIVAAPPCVINNNNLIEVNFGNDVLTTRVDGSYKKMPLIYSLDCGDFPSNAVRMRIGAIGAVFDPEVVHTNVPDFGIALLNNGNPYPTGTWLNFNLPSPPKLEAVPVKRVGSTLKGGTFSASANMKVEYQ